MVFIRPQSTCLSESDGHAQSAIPDLGELDDQESYFQVLLIEANPAEKKVNQTLTTRKKKDFEDYKLEKQPENPKNIAECLPSQGVKFPKELEDSLSDKPLYRDNFYATSRCLLQARKISQLTARTWWAYRIYWDFLRSEAEEKKGGEQYYIVSGNWENILEYLDEYLLSNSGKVKLSGVPNEETIEQLVLDILDGLIAREIFLSANASPLGITHFDLKDEDQGVYNVDYHRDITPNRMMILPTSRAWSGIRLALLFAGQAFRKRYVRVDGKYICKEDEHHRIFQPILSTAEIIAHYAMQSSIESFHGQIEEVPIGLAYDLPYLVAKIPYPPIPTEDQVRTDQLEKWFQADENSDSPNKFPFFCKHQGKYRATIQNPTPPYPYIPISTS